MLDEATLGQGSLAQALFGEGVVELGALSFGNTFLPLVVLAALTVVLPALTVPRGTLSQLRLALGMALAGALVFAAALALFAALHRADDSPLRWAALTRPAAMTALVWGPLWALVWLHRVQGVERRRGVAAVRAGVDLGERG